ncbi:MAG TPA: type II toxin-antitoxin system RelE/ParE family toxin [Chthoniobacterales bacterium]|nr:type II toxin-antitoxin system RelE/ParE family toxin [Chthoniobacterales bacterium]
MPEVVWKQGAENDLLEIFSNLEEHEQGLGERLVERLDFTLAHLRQHPEMAPIFEPLVRRLVIGSTGFGLFYSVESRGIIVHALVHLARNPETIRARVRRLLGFN